MSATGCDGFSSPFSRIVLVASCGGMAAFSAVLSGLPATFPVPVAVIQHRVRTGEGRDVLAAALARKIALPVRVAVDGKPADEPGVTVVPGATAATIDSSGRWVLTEAVRGASVGDVLLASSAQAVPTSP